MYKVIVERIQMSQIEFSQDEYDDWAAECRFTAPTHEAYAQDLVMNLDENFIDWTTSAVIPVGVMV